jgi:proline iminopeptidase
MRIALSALALLLTAACASTRHIDAGDGVRVWSTTRGRGAPIIVIHGGPGMDHNSLAADLKPLERNHRVVYYDQRGGGRSTLTERVSIDDHVNDLEALRRHLGLEKITVLAHSFGPAIAALYAIKHPDRVDRMIFLGPIPPRKATFFEDYGAALSARLTTKQIERQQELQAMYGDANADVIAVCREYWSIGTPPRVARSLSPTLVKSDFCTASAAAIRFGMTKTNEATFASLGDWDWTADLVRVSAPVLVIHGEEDAIPMKLVEEWATALPSARLLRLPDTAHFPHAERPEIVFPAIEEFLARR